MARNVPTGSNGKVLAAGTYNQTFFATIGAGTVTTTGWDEIKLPANVECKNFIICPRSALDATALTEDPIKFLYSTVADGTGGVPCPGVIIPGIKKSGGDTLGYVKTGVAGLKVSVLVID